MGRRMVTVMITRWRGERLPLMVARRMAEAPVAEEKHASQRTDIRWDLVSLRVVCLNVIVIASTPLVIARDPVMTTPQIERREKRAEEARVTRKTRRIRTRIEIVIGIETKTRRETETEREAVEERIKIVEENTKR
jgi:hypothetical protein